MVARSPHGPVSQRVDEIGDVMDLDAGGFDPPPDNVDPAIGGLLRSVVQVERPFAARAGHSREPPRSSLAAKVAAKRSHDERQRK